MGTVYNVTVVVDDDTALPEYLKEQVQAQLEAIDASMSTYKQESELSRLNADDSGQWLELSPPLFKVISAAMEISRQSDGAFDVTVGPLVDAWGFGPGDWENQAPSAEVIEALRQRIGYDKIELRPEPPAIKKPAGVTIDLSAIAKGFAVDEVGALLQSHDLQNYLVEIGGEISVRGFNAENAKWKIGIEKPALNRQGVVQALQLSDKAVATSGDYRNFFEQNGVRFSHTIDPRTGKPIAHNLASVTVIADNAMQADAWATAFNVMGIKKAKTLAQQRDLAVYFIYHQGDEFLVDHTATMQKYLLEH